MCNYKTRAKLLLQREQHIRSPFRSIYHASECEHAQLYRLSPIVNFLFLISFHVCFHCLMWRNGKLWNWILLAIANSYSVFGSLQGACWWLRARGDWEPLKRAAGEPARGSARGSARPLLFSFSFFFFLELQLVWRHERKTSSVCTLREVCGSTRAALC